MSDDIPAENEAVDEPTTEEASPAPEQTTQDNAPTEAEEQVDAPAEAEAPESKPKHNAESRIKALVKENKALKQPRSQGEQPSRGNSKFSDQFQGKDNVSPDDLDAAVEQYVGQAANAILDAKMKPLVSVVQQDRLEQDVLNVQRNHPELDPASDQYDSKLDQAIADSYKEFGQSVRLSAFVDKQMSLATANSKRANQQADATVSKQAEETAVRPGVKSKAETKFEDLSVEDMEAKLGMVR